MISRIPESLPSLHDEVLAAAARAAMNLSSAHDKKQVWEEDHGFLFHMI